MSTRGRLLAIMAVSLAALVMLMALAFLASTLLSGPANDPVWTPALLSRTSQPSPTARLLPTEPLTATPRPTLTLLRPAPTTTPGDSGGEANRMIITQQDVLEVLSNPSLYPEGLEAQGLDVRFTGGKIYLTADSVAYGMLRMRDLSLVGRLAAQDGRLQVEVESVSPAGLAGALIPQLANQAMSQLGGRWYVEDVQVGEGEVSVRYR